ncbi:MAG: hypothetical protein OK454_08580, partial [Thaumarchaeota archaeon]|nr:hypothetical protein [Nitrososphaerota archaeon]
MSHTLQQTTHAESGLRGLSFLDLPPEIRLRIYSFVHEIHPFQPRPLASWMPLPTQGICLNEPVIPRLAVARDGGEERVPWDKGTGSQAGRTDSPPLLSPHRPLAYMPSALLRSCRQVYHEARHLPFRANEFVFVDWFSSGLGAARASVRALAPWQRQCLSYVRLEARAADLSAKGLGENKSWAELCELWGEGLRGLRLRVSVDRGAFVPRYRDAEQVPGGGEKTAITEMGCDHSPAWVDVGLKKLRRLRNLEIELADT